ncbi:hypothetical protein SF23_17560 [Streptomyces sp. MBRL 10]|nr:hypothetical protein SF23_17560 [Streptomyces sp. MBRL 10]
MVGDDRGTARGDLGEPRVADHRQPLLLSASQRSRGAVRTASRKPVACHAVRSAGVRSHHASCAA